MRVASTVGIKVPDDFPLEPYEAIHALMRGIDPPCQGHFSGGWNAIVRRFVTADKFSKKFAESLKAFGDMPPPDKRADQEEDLFVFFTSACSVIDSIFYALYAILAHLRGNEVSLDESALRNINPKSTLDALNKLFPGEACSLALSTALSDQQFKRLKYMRNVLNHRLVPARQAFVGGKKHAQTELKLKDGIPFNAELTATSRYYLGELTREMLVSIESFCRSRVQQI